MLHVHRMAMGSLGAERMMRVETVTLLLGVFTSCVCGLCV